MRAVTAGIAQVTADSLQLVRTVRSYYGQGGVTAGSARSYCGQCAQLLRTVRTVTADRSNVHMSRKYVFGSRKTMTQNQDPSFAMGLTDVAVVSCNVSRDQYNAVYF